MSEDIREKLLQQQQVWKDSLLAKGYPKSLLDTIKNIPSQNIDEYTERLNARFKSKGWIIPSELPKMRNQYLTSTVSEVRKHWEEMGNPPEMLDKFFASADFLKSLDTAEQTSMSKGESTVKYQYDTNSILNLLSVKPVTSKTTVSTDNTIETSSNQESPQLKDKVTPMSDRKRDSGGHHIGEQKDYDYGEEPVKPKSMFSVVPDEPEEVPGEENIHENSQEDDLLKKKEHADSILTYLRHMDNINQYADTILQDTYNTRAVNILDVLRVASEEQLQLDIYEKPVYSVIIQVNEPWVAEVVQSVLNNWKDKDSARKYVEDYLRHLGTKEEDMEKTKADLISYLGADYANDPAPDEFKQFEAVRLLMQEPQYEKMSKHGDKDIFQNHDSAMEYGAALEDELEDGTPSQAAAANATQAANDVLEEKSSGGVAGKAGAFCGKVLGLKYKTAQNFQDMLVENLGEYGVDYQQHREEIKTRKAEIREKKEELKHQEKLQKMEAKSQAKQEDIERKAERKREADERKEEEKELRKEERQAEREQRRMDRGNAMRSGYGNGYGNGGYGGYGNQGYMNNGYGNQGYGRRFGRNRGYGNSYGGYGNSYGGYGNSYGGRNFGGSRIPLFLILIIINLILGLLTWIIFGKVSAIIGAVGLIIAICGGIRKRLNEQGAILMIIGGYAFFILTIIFSIM